MSEYSCNKNTRLFIVHALSSEFSSFKHVLRIGKMVSQEFFIAKLSIILLSKKKFNSDILFNLILCPKAFQAEVGIIMSVINNWL